MIYSKRPQTDCVDLFDVCRNLEENCQKKHDEVEVESAYEVFFEEDTNILSVNDAL